MAKKISVKVAKKGPEESNEINIVDYNEGGNNGTEVDNNPSTSNNMKYEDVWSNGNGPVDPVRQEASERENVAGKSKVSFGEKIAMSAQNKLIKLREKFSEKPPKTAIGKMLANARINRLSNMVERRILKNKINNIKSTYKAKEDNKNKEYLANKDGMTNRMSRLGLEKENLLREADALRNQTPQNVSQATIMGQQGNNQTTSQTNPSANSQANEAVEKRKQEIVERLKRIEEEERKGKEYLNNLDKEFKDEKEDIRKEFKKEMALAKPSMRERMKAFFDKKIAEFKAWREEKRNKADEKLSATIANTENSTKRERFLKDNNANISLEDQAKNSAQIQEDLQKQVPQKESEKDREVVGE